MKMEKFIQKVLDKYERKKLPNRDLADLIVAHIKVGIDGEKGWHLNLSSYDGQHEKAEQIIQEYQ